MVVLFAMVIMLLVKAFKPTPNATPNDGNSNGNGGSSIHGTEADDIGGFNNPVTFTILLTLILMFVSGLYLTWIGEYLIGTILTLGSGGLAAAGYTSHSPEKPKEIGLITFWDKPLIIGKTYFTVAGDVFLLPFFPFNLKTIKITMDNTDEVFKGDDFVFQTKDGVYITLEISVTTTPEPKDLIDYIQAGADMKKVFGQIREILYREAQHIIKDMDAEEVQKEVKRVSQDLKASLKESGSFGIDVRKVQVVPALPKGYRDKKQAFAEEGLDRKAELKEYETMRIAAEELQTSSARQFVPNIDSLSQVQRSEQIGQLVVQGRIPTFEKCLDEVKTMRLIRDGKAIKVDASGNTGTVLIPNAQFNVGGKP